MTMSLWKGDQILNGEDCNNLNVAIPGDKIITDKEKSL